MPVSVSYPGVYIEEIPSGVRTITGVATSITAFLGRAPRGPIDDPVTINSFADFDRRFGGLVSGYPMGYAVKDFYLNGGSTALIVRLYKRADEEEDGVARLEVGKLTLKASSPGKWGDKLRAAIEVVSDPEAKAAQGLAAGDDLFNLTVTDTSPGGSTETIQNLAVKEKAVRRVDKVLAAESSLVRWDGDTWPLDDDPAAITGITAEKDDATAKEETVGAAEKDFQEKKNAWVAEKNAATPDEDKVKAAKTKMDDAAKALDKARAEVGTTETKREAADSEPLDQGTFEGDADKKTGMQALVKADLFNLLCIPPDIANGDVPGPVYQTAMQFCAEHRAMLIVDSPAAWSKNREEAAGRAKAGLTDLGLTGAAARNAALYFPRVRQANPLHDGRIEVFVPCGIIAGVMARTDTARGVWKAPAGLDATLAGVAGLDAELNDLENGMLNPLGINCLRAFPIYGRVVWGARTLRGADQLADEYKYVPVRRLALYIEESLYRGTKWVVFEPNDEPLWAQIRLNIGAFMHNLFRQGAFQGATPRDAYFVKCDKETTTQNDINLGIVNIVVGFAPLKPAEFVIIKLQQMAGQIEV
jgi:phage tail sheath protein FI